MKNIAVTFKCPHCERWPKLMVTHVLGALYHYECCGIMGAFPGASDKDQAARDWDSKFK